MPTYPDVNKNFDRFVATWEQEVGDPEIIQLHAKCENYTPRFRLAVSIADSPALFLVSEFHLYDFQFASNLPNTEKQTAPKPLPDQDYACFRRLI